MPDFNNPVMDPDEDVRNTSQNILDNEEPRFHRPAISGPNAELLDSAMVAEMDPHRRNHTWDVVDRPTDRTIIDSKWMFNIKSDLDRSINTLNARFVAKGFSQIQGQDYDERFAWVVCFNSLGLHLVIVAANGFVSQQLDVNSAFRYG
jgi:hypothetical protein